jgi:putative glutathione S-transferase
MLVNGKWVAKWDPVQAKDDKGGFVRQTSTFRNWVTPDGRPGPTGDGGFTAEAGRYHLYVGLICPWASRTLMARKLKGLDEVISISIVEPELTDQGWRFAPGGDVAGAATYMHEIYTRSDASVNGRATIPVLWDKQTARIVNNESADILRIFNSGFGPLASGPDLYPEALRADIDSLNDAIYATFNNGVYRAGFATTQLAYDEAFADVFATLDALELRLSDGRAYLHGSTFTETDIRAFVTLARFDAAYHGLFKCNPQLSAYVARVYRLPGIAETVSIDHIKRGYYSIKALNPNGIVPLGPKLDWITP